MTVGTRRMTRVTVVPEPADLVRPAAGWLAAEIGEDDPRSRRLRAGAVGRPDARAGLPTSLRGPRPRLGARAGVLRGRARGAAGSRGEQLSHGAGGAALPGRDSRLERPPHGSRATRPRRRGARIRAGTPARARRPAARRGGGWAYRVAVSGLAGAGERRRLVVPVTGTKPPTERLTITPPVIGAAPAGGVLATGRTRRRWWPGRSRARSTPGEVPAQLARHGVWFLDRAAAGRLIP